MAEIASLKAKLEAPELAALKPRAFISLNEYAARIDFSRSSARRRVLKDPKLGEMVGGRWRIWKTP
jgi:hypothetical protein